jgi:hypothetical protein
MKTLVMMVIAVAAIVLAINADAIVAYSYDFNEGTGNVLNDSSGNGNNGTITGSPTWGSGTLIFDGVDDVVNVPFDASMNILGPVVLEYRLKIGANATTNYAFTRNSVAQARSTSTWLASDLYYQGKGGVTHWIAVVTNTWYDIKTVYDGIDQITYLDGSEVARTAVGTDDVRQYAQDIWMGQFSGGGYNWAGEIDYISYQSYAIPEPSILLSGLALLAFKRRK